MKPMPIRRSTSAGLFLTYRCTNTCKHCMYACSPRWPADWISEQDGGSLRGVPAPTVLLYRQAGPQGIQHRPLIAFQEVQLALAAQGAERVMRDACLNQIYEGTNPINLLAFVGAFWESDLAVPSPAGIWNQYDG